MPIDPNLGNALDSLLGDLKPRDREVAARAARRATADLGHRLKVKPSGIVLLKIVQSIWSDASLGCPDPDHFYAQVLTTGYAVFLVYGKDTYEYRTDGKRILVYVGPIGADR